MDNVNANTLDNENKKIKKKKGRRVALTTIGYILIIVFLLAVLPVILPPIFGYHTRNVETDHSGAVWEVCSVAYYKNCDFDDLKDEKSQQYIATDANYSSKEVDVYLATGILEDAVQVDGGDIIDGDNVRGIVKAKTPYIGLLTGLCFSIPGIIALVLIFGIGLACMILANKISKEVNQKVYEQKKAKKSKA